VRIDIAISPEPPHYVDHIIEDQEIASFRDDITSLQVLFAYGPDSHPAFRAYGPIEVLVKGIFIPDLLF
jgi:hypothetical protein